MESQQQKKKTYYEQHKEEILQKANEQYAYRKEHHLCARCGKPLGELKTVNCTECLATHNANGKQHYEQHKEKRREYYRQNREQILQKRKELYQQRREQGLCTRCGQPLAPNSISYCEDCLLKKKKSRWKQAKLNNQ